MGGRTPLPGALPGAGFCPALLGWVVQNPWWGGHEPPLTPGGHPRGVPMGRHRSVGLALDWDSSYFGVWGGWVDPKG